MIILVETLQPLQFQQYSQKHPISEVGYDNIKHFQSNLSNTSPNEIHSWDLHENTMRKHISQYETFTKDSREKSTQFAFWHVFLSDVVSVLDLVSYRSNHIEKQIVICICQQRVVLFLYSFSSIALTTNAGFHYILKIV